MKNTGFILFVFFLVCLTQSQLSAQNKTAYLCPDLGLTFSSQTELIEQNASDSDCITLANRNGNLQVSIWKTIDSGDCYERLREIIRAEGLQEMKAPEKDMSKDICCPVLFAGGQSMHQPFRFIFAAVHMEDAMIIVRIKCPEECFFDHSLQVKYLLNSLMVNS